MKLKVMLLVFLGVVIGSMIFVGISVSAASTYDEIEGYGVFSVEENQIYTVEDMLTFAIEDEYLAQATYLAIIDAYGQIKPFSKIVLAEQKHIDLLLPLFSFYSIEAPVNIAANLVVLPDSISSALATGVEAEKLNIAMYEIFLSQVDLPEDVKTVFEYLLAASENHLRAFSKDRLIGTAYDLGNMYKHRHQKGNQNGNQQNNNNGNCSK